MNLTLGVRPKFVIFGVVEGNRPATDNDWEKIKKGGYRAVRKWIYDQMRYRSCTVVLVGSNTANRYWINYEIIKSWNEGMGVAGIYIHGLKDSGGYISGKGDNPFDCIRFEDGQKLSTLVKCYSPKGENSQERYDWISKHLLAVIEEALNIRRNH